MSQFLWPVWHVLLIYKLHPVQIRAEHYAPNIMIGMSENDRTQLRIEIIGTIIYMHNNTVVLLVCSKNVIR